MNNESSPIDDFSKFSEELADHLKKGIPLDVSPEVLALAKQVVAEQKARQNEDIGEWAKNLVNSMYNSPGFKDSDY
jgi:hypothetical protein